MNDLSWNSDSSGELLELLRVSLVSETFLKAKSVQFTSKEVSQQPLNWNICGRAEFCLESRFHLNHPKQTNTSVLNKEAIGIVPWQEDILHHHSSLVEESRNSGRLWDRPSQHLAHPLPCTMVVQNPEKKKKKQIKSRRKKTQIPSNPFSVRQKARK